MLLIILSFEWEPFSMNIFVGLGLGGDDIPLEALLLDLIPNCWAVVLSRNQDFRVPFSTIFNFFISQPSSSKGFEPKPLGILGLSIILISLLKILVFIFSLRKLEPLAIEAPFTRDAKWERRVLETLGSKTTSDLHVSIFFGLHFETVFSAACFPINEASLRSSKKTLESYS